MRAGHNLTNQLTSIVRMVACFWIVQGICTRAQAPAAPTVKVVSLPGRDWGVTFDSTGFEPKISEMRPGGRRYLELVNSATKVVISFTLEPAGAKSRSCKSINQQREDDSNVDPLVASVVGLDKKDVRLWSESDRSILDYTLSLPKQKNRFICFEHDNVFVDIHISKTDFAKAELAVFDHLASSITIHDIPARGAMDYWKVAGELFLHKQYQESIAPYEKALELEKATPQLEKQYWYVLIDNLGMAYGITGELEKARSLFEYGIQRDPDYPLFYYNLACYYGEKSDADNAAAYLRKAFDRKANVIPGESIPDPRSDDSFQTLLRDPAFRARVDSIVGHL